MARVKGAMATRKRRNKVLKLAKGYWGGKSKLFKTAKEAVMKSGQYAYIGRRLKKRDFRKLWITRISAACKMNGMNYSTFMNGLKKSGSTLNRKVLSEIAIHDPAAFTALTEQAKKHFTPLVLSDPGRLLYVKTRPASLLDAASASVPQKGKFADAPAGKAQNGTDPVQGKRTHQGVWEAGILPEIPGGDRLFRAGRRKAL